MIDWVCKEGPLVTLNVFLVFYSECGEINHRFWALSCWWVENSIDTIKSNLHAIYSKLRNERGKKWDKGIFPNDASFHHKSTYEMHYQMTAFSLILHHLSDLFCHPFHLSPWDYIKVWREVVNKKTDILRLGWPWGFDSSPYSQVFCDFVLHLTSVYENTWLEN